MKVKIGLLKNELSKYLQKVRKGEEITVTDRNVAIAKIIPLERPIVRGDLNAWVTTNLPVSTAKKQPNSIEILRALREEG